MTKFYIGFLSFNLSKALAESEDWTIDLRDYNRAVVLKHPRRDKRQVTIDLRTWI